MRARLILDRPETDADRLIYLIQTRLPPLLEELGGRGQVLEELGLLFRFERLGEHKERIRPAAPTLDIRQILELIRLRLSAARPRTRLQRRLVRRLYRRPIPLPPHPRHAPDGWMLHGLEQGPVVRVWGPYVVAGGWWVRPLHREYHFAETRKGELLWVFYDRVRRGLVRARAGGVIPLWCKSHFSFLEGASHPEELVETCAALGLAGLALTDRDGVYGLVEAHVKARELGVPLIAGAEVSIEDGSTLILLAQSREGYANLCRLLTLGRRRCAKGESRVGWREVYAHAGDLIALWGGEPALLCGEADPFFIAHQLREAYDDRLYALAARHRRADE